MVSTTLGQHYPDVLEGPELRPQTPDPDEGPGAFGYMSCFTRLALR